MNSITEEMRFRQRLCEYAMKHGVTRAARRYHTNRQFVYRQLKKYDGTVRSLALKSRRPHHNPKRSHREDGKILYSREAFTNEKELIKQVAKCETRYNKTAKAMPIFKSPNQVVLEYFSRCDICLDN